MIAPNAGRAPPPIKTVSSGTGRDARAVRGVRNSGASVSRLIFISPLATLRGWRAEVAGRWVSADLTRGTNKFDGTPIRNSTCLSMAMGLIRGNILLIAYKTCGNIRMLKVLKSMISSNRLIKNFMIIATRSVWQTKMYVCMYACSR